MADVLKPAIQQVKYTQTTDPYAGHATALMDDTTATMDSLTVYMGQPSARIEKEIRLRPVIYKGRIRQ